MPRRPRDLSPEALRKFSDALAEERAAANRSDAPLFLKQQVTAALRKEGLLTPNQRLRWREDGMLEVVKKNS